MSVGIYNEEINTQIIQTPLVINGESSFVSFCFPDEEFGPDCTQCFKLEHISFVGPVVQANLTFEYSCERTGPLMTISFGEIQGESAPCGAPGYFYTSCSFNKPRPSSGTPSIEGNSADNRKWQNVISSPLHFSLLQPFTWREMLLLSS